MPKIDKITIEKLMDAAKIEEVIQECLGKYEPHNPNGLKKSGVRYKALCPFHDDKSMGSFKGQLLQVLQLWCQGWSD